MSRTRFVLGTALAVVVILAALAPAPQAAPAELAQRGRPGGVEPPPHLALEPGPGGPAPASAPAGLGDWTRLAFQSLRDGNWEVYRADGDGANQMRLTGNAVSDLQPDLNRGGTRIAFTTYRDNNWDIYAMNADGSGQGRLTFEPKVDANPDWSPDGSRIAFESQRTASGDIYVMGADGSNQARLTTNEDPDLEPAWSPDGGRIAFTSYRNSVWRIWGMNADGSDQVQLSGQPYSEHAAWSPDGREVAYDADADGDGFWELWLMNADGSEQREVYSPPEAQTDAFAGGWSPDGRYLAFARVSWIEQGGNWYWTAAYLDAWDRATGAVARLSSQGLDWMPDWQATETLPPSSSVETLPGVSPSPIEVHWSGTDDGPAGLRSFDVQVREGPGGEWVNWLVDTAERSGSYPGSGNQTYYFRCRGRDNAYNLEAYPAGHDAVTTVEGLPPVTAVELLPAFWPYWGYLRFGGADRGGSGIASYRLEYATQPGGPWTDPGWVIRSAAVRLGSLLQPGATYYFRSRGTDRAGNTEAPHAASDTSTSLFRYAVRGVVTDNAGGPVGGATVTTAPAAWQAFASDAAGAYAAYLVPQGWYEVAWDKAGYGDLPATSSSRWADDAQVDVALPPADNLVADWGFEGGDLGPNWQPAGSLPPEAAGDAQHTGAFGARFGLPGVLGSTTNLSNDSDSGSPRLALDSSDRAHVAWTRAGALVHAWRDAAGNWSAPAELDSVGGDSHQLAADGQGAVHAVWLRPGGSGGDVTYARWGAGEGWSSPACISQCSGASSLPKLAVEGGGTVHVLWRELTSGGHAVAYARRDAGGAWSEPQIVASAPGEVADLDTAVDGLGSVHAVWLQGARQWYARRAPDGTWAGPTEVAQASSEAQGPRLAADALGNVHVLWQDVGIRHRYRSAGGTWSGETVLSEEPSPLWFALGSGGSLHVAWQTLFESDYQVVYSRRGADGTWDTPEIVSLWSGYEQGYGALAEDGRGTVHLVWAPASVVSMRYARKPAGGRWERPVEVDAFSDFTRHTEMATDSHGAVHIAWGVSDFGLNDVCYATSAQSAQSGDGEVSQAIGVPADMPSPTLSFVYQLQRSAPDSGTRFEVEADDGTVHTTLLSTAQATSGWERRWFSLAPWAGQTITLRFALNEAAGHPAAWAFLDEVTVGRAHANVWVSKTCLTPVALPGGEVRFRIEYGNRGGAPANGSVVTDTLPAGLTFLSSDPPPTSVTPWLTWEVGDLPAGGGPLAIVLTAGVGPDVPLGTTLVNAAQIGTSSLELETMDNQASGSVWLGRRVLLPLIGWNW